MCLPLLCRITGQHIVLKLMCSVHRNMTCVHKAKAISFTWGQWATQYEYFERWDARTPDPFACFRTYSWFFSCASLSLDWCVCVCVADFNSNSHLLWLVLIKWHHRIRQTHKIIHQICVIWVVRLQPTNIIYFIRMTKQTERMRTNIFPLEHVTSVYD